MRLISSGRGMKGMFIKSLPCLCLFIAVALNGCSGNHQQVNSGVPAKSSPPTQVSTSAEVVKVRTTGVTIPSGGEATAIVTLSISSGFHVNANPATFSYLIPTEVTAESAEEINVDKAVYPAGRMEKFQFADQPLAVYEGETQIKLPLRAKANGAKVSTSLPIKVRVQACDNEQCFPPATLNTTLAADVK